ncbi:MAG: 50S ribosomal protein L3 [Candidatus Absconditabacteria bacterium]
MRYTIMLKGGLIVRKQEMTKIWVNDAFTAVTLVKILPQEIIRYKTDEVDGYVAAVIGVSKKEVATKKGTKNTYAMVSEFKVAPEFVAANEAGKILTADFVEGIETVNATAQAIEKGFQGMVKKWHVKGMGATHGHKFTRTGGSKGNRKPRRTMKGHPHAGHMGTQTVTVKDIKVLDVLKRENEEILVLKGSIPGAYNCNVKIVLN